MPRHATPRHPSTRTKCSILLYFLVSLPSTCRFALWTSLIEFRPDSPALYRHVAPSHFNTFTTLIYICISVSSFRHLPKNLPLFHLPSRYHQFLRRFIVSTSPPPPPSTRESFPLFFIENGFPPPPRPCPSHLTTIKSELSSPTIGYYNFLIVEPI